MRRLNTQIFAGMFPPSPLARITHKADCSRPVDLKKDAVFFPQSAFHRPPCLFCFVAFRCLFFLALAYFGTCKPFVQEDVSSESKTDSAVCLSVSGCFLEWAVPSCNAPCSPSHSFSILSLSLSYRIISSGRVKEWLLGGLGSCVVLHSLTDTPSDPSSYPAGDSSLFSGVSERHRDRHFFLEFAC